MNTQYQQLQPDKRLALSAMRIQGKSWRSITAMLWRSPSTISRELRDAMAMLGAMLASLPKHFACNAK